MPAKPTKSKNFEVIKTRLKVHNLPSKFKNLPSRMIAIFADSPELDPVIEIIIEQNNTIRSANGRRLVAENTVESLKLKFKQFVNPDKSEIVQLWSKFFGKATKNDDQFLKHIGAISKETARKDLEKAEQVVDESIDVAEKYRQKYGKIDRDKRN
ncbi:MAG: hypothetical protein QNJ54_18790 [Prochloraceae cyanobacterium]|nr:hypothetical protein [Prochloraceae cyanobacterium]